MPSSIARTMNGVVAVVSSLTVRAFLHSASETFCGLNDGKPDEDAGRDGGGVGGDADEDEDD